MCDPVTASNLSRPDLGPHVQWEAGALSPAVKRPKREADKSHPSDAVIVNASVLKRSKQSKMEMRFGGCELDAYGSGWDPVTGSCETL
jgi:hypothetical protein